MSIRQEIYVGTYFQIWLPREPYAESGWSRCPSCARRMSTPFCASCGERGVPEIDDRFIDFYDLCEAIFADGEVLSVAIERSDHVVVIGNIPTRQEGLHIDEETEGAFPIRVHPPGSDWIRLAAGLAQRNIAYREEWGVVTYFR